MWHFLHDTWWRLATQSHPQSFSDALTSGVLQIGSVAYRVAVALRNAAYDRGWVGQVTLPCRVVSVGNLTLGGTGKTACVELITKKLLALGKRVAVLSRGYGGSRRHYWLRWESGRLMINGEGNGTRDPSTHPSSEAIGSLRMSPTGLPRELYGLADEPRLLAMHLEGVPIIVGARRDRTGWLACTEFGSDTVVLDDGFQHRGVRRDCEIVLIHARMPFGGWAMLPRGPMREPLTSLKRAHIVVMTKADEALELLEALRERLRSFNPEATFVTAAHEPTTLVDGLTGEPHDPNGLSGLRVGLLSSIGDPAGFESTIRRLQATVLWHRTFPDHYAYQAADWVATLEEAKERGPDVLITTEKDWVRLQPWTVDRGPWTVPLWVLGVRMKVLSGEGELDARLASVYAR
jgi:tetraacyldisaccharide 4'-kinase